MRRGLIEDVSLSVVSYQLSVNWCAEDGVGLVVVLYDELVVVDELAIVDCAFIGVLGGIIVNRFKVGGVFLLNNP